MNKNKCIKKQKLSKKNKNKTKNKHKNKTNKFLYKINGGSNINATASASVSASNKPQNNFTPPTLKKLIENDEITKVIIMFNGLQIKCKIGQNTFSTRNYGCIAVSYDFENHVSTRDGFFYKKSKTDCIGLENIHNINNKDYKELYEKQEKKETYNKSLNKLLLKLIDIINIELKMTHCVVIDDATITCINKNKISLDIKHYSRGYGFYNEFGYIYINNDKKVNIDTLEQKIIYANKILNSIHVLSHNTIIELEDKLKKIAVKDNDDILDILHNFNISKINLLNLCEILNISDAPTKTVRNLLNEIFQIMCTIIINLTIEQQDYLNLFTKIMLVLQNIDNYKPHTFIFHKYYNTTNKDGHVYTSELNIPHIDENSVPSFVMREFTQPTITIRDSDIDEYKYIIEIT